MNGQISEQAEQTIKQAAKLIGTPEADKVLRLIYTMGYMDGALSMASVGIGQLQDALKAAA